MNEPILPPRRVIYRGKKIDLALQPLPLADGSLATREVVVHRGAVALLAFVDPDHIVLLRNFRHTVGRTLIEIPAGTLEPDEAPAATAARELIEETGYAAARITHLTTWLVSPGVMTEQMHLYLCEDLTPGPTEHQPDERLEPVVVPWTEALSMTRDGRIHDAKTMLALLWYDQRRRLLVS